MARYSPDEWNVATFQWKFDRLFRDSHPFRQSYRDSDIKKTTEFLNFRAKLGFLLYSLEIMDGGNEYSTCSLTNAMVVYPRLLVGMTEDEIKTFIRASIRWDLAELLESFTYTSAGGLSVEGPYSKVLRVFSGQEATMRALRAAGIAVYIISASPELYADEAADLLGLGYLVARDNVYGGRFTTNSAGLFTGELLDDYPITWGPGKATVVKSILMPNHKGAAPIYSSGDSDGDCEMLSTVRDGIVDTNNHLMDNSTSSTRRPASTSARRSPSRTTRTCCRARTSPSARGPPRSPPRTASPPTMDAQSTGSSTSRPRSFSHCQIL